REACLGIPPESLTQIADVGALVGVLSRRLIDVLNLAFAGFRDLWSVVMLPNDPFLPSALAPVALRPEAPWIWIRSAFEASPFRCGIDLRVFWSSFAPSPSFPALAA